MRVRALLWACVVCLACEGPHELWSASANRAGIYGGVLDAGDAAVVGLALSEAGDICTGVLIAPDVVLTASHCVGKHQPGFAEARAIFGGHLSSSEAVPIASVQASPAYDSASKANDLGLIRLAGPAPAGATPVPLPPADFALATAHQGTAIRFVGYGRSESSGPGAKREVSLTLGLVCPGPGACGYLGLSVAPGSFGYDQASGGPCTGDSGGPVLMRIAGVESVIGVNASGDPGCTVMGMSTTVDRHRALIAAFIGATPDPEPEPEPTSDPEPSPEPAACEGAVCDEAPPPLHGGCVAAAPDSLTWGFIVAAVCLGRRRRVPRRREQPSPLAISSAEPRPRDSG